ncbi:biotin transporter BioY [Methanosalsum natronophilum]|uniref:Biotin transporter BioY n=1 Tax=Methanosalsum natronophilum TaxID=768733 RepID=A0A424Z4L6_9EURY|nr:MAG: biotin transporter BioY [Methanosalsum natronophilum]
MVNIKGEEFIHTDSEDLKKMVLAAFFAALIAVAAYIRIPLPISPVPITAQILFVFLAATYLGKKWGTISLIVYLLLGIVGLPVFAGGGSGVGVLLGPTGGYLLGFVFAAFMIGSLKEKTSCSSFFHNSLIIFSGLILIYALGVLQMSIVANLNLEEAIIVGVVPFLVPDIIKVVAAAYITSNYEV